MDIAILFLKPIEYRNFAMPLKLFEYLEQEKPILAVNGTATGEFVKTNEIGWTLEYDRVSLQKWTDEITKNREIILGKENKIQLSKMGNTWNERATKVIEDLMI